MKIFQERKKLVWVSFATTAFATCVIVKLRTDRLFNAVFLEYEPSYHLRVEEIIVNRGGIYFLDEDSRKSYVINDVVYCFLGDSFQFKNSRASDLYLHKDSTSQTLIFVRKSDTLLMEMEISYRDGKATLYSKNQYCD